MLEPTLAADDLACRLRAAQWEAAGRRPDDGAWIFRQVHVSGMATRYIVAASLPDAMQRLLNDLASDDQAATDASTGERDPRYCPDHVRTRRASEPTGEGAMSEQQEPTDTVATSVGEATVAFPSAQELRFELTASHPGTKPGKGEYVIQGTLVRAGEAAPWSLEPLRIARAGRRERAHEWQPKGSWRPFAAAIQRDVVPAVTAWAQSPAGQQLLDRTRQSGD